MIGGIFLPAAASLISTGFNTLRKVESDDRTQVVIGLSLLPSRHRPAERVERS